MSWLTETKKSPILTKFWVEDKDACGIYTHRPSPGIFKLIREPRSAKSLLGEIPKAYGNTHTVNSRIPTLDL